MTSKTVGEIAGELRQLLAKATPLPWTVGETNPFPDEPDEIAIMGADGSAPAVAIPAGARRDAVPTVTAANAALIASAISALPALLSALESQTEEDGTHTPAVMPEGEGIIQKAADALKAIDDLIADSGGVYGLHLNGDPAPWSELMEGGRFEEWLLPLEPLRAALTRTTKEPS